MDRRDKALEDLFEASERVYALSLEMRERGAVLPDGDQEPEAIALEVLMHSLEAGVPCPEWARKCVLACWERFERFEVSSINEAFRVPRHKHHAARRDERYSACVYSKVRELQKQGVPLKSSSKRRGALEIVGAEFNFSPRKVEELMGQWKRLCAHNGSDPDREHKLPDFRAELFSTVARAFAPPFHFHKKA